MARKYEVLKAQTECKPFLFFSNKFLNLHFYFVDKENTADCWFACFQENMNNLNEMLKRFEARQVQILLQIKVSSAFQSG